MGTIAEEGKEVKDPVEKGTEEIALSKSDANTLGNAEDKKNNDVKENEDVKPGAEEEVDPYYPPIIYLPEVVVNSGEDGEEEMFKRRARLYRYAHECKPAEWKERGTGDVRILRNEETGNYRVVMRREKTLKLCANHLITPIMELRHNCGNPKSWVWKTTADFADEEAKQETLAIRFGTEENAKAFEKVFMKARQAVLEAQAVKAKREQDGEPADENNKDSSSKNVADATKDDNSKDESVEKKEEEIETKMTGLRV